jgi:dipeptidyl aminopeptidase/acylaminoacyl peptidase
LGVFAQDANPFVLTYKDRSVDSAPYSFAFPYRLEHATIEHRKLYFSRHVEGEGKHLYVTDWDPANPISLNSETATKVTTINLNGINFWRRYLNTRLGGLIAEADDDKAERINLWLFADGADAPRRLTDVDYVYEFTQSEDHGTIYYTARYGSSDAAKGCLEELRINEDGNTTTRQLICDDDPAMPASINWWTKLRADEDRVVFPALQDGDRNKQELYAYDLSDGSVSLLFEGHGTSWLDIRRGWGDETQLLFSADRDLYRYDFDANEAKLLHRFDRTISGFKPAGTGAAPNIMVTTETPFETKLEVFAVNPDGLVPLSETKLPEDVWIADGYDGQVLIGRFSPETYAAFDMLSVSPDGSFVSQEAVAGLAEINDQLSQCDVERVQVTHEDTSAQSPGTFTLDVFLYRPRDLPPIEDQKFIITAYYGGENTFSSYHHLFCALGINTVSPAVRGDWRYGTEFANGNDREKADAPVRDTLAVARYLIDRFDIRDSRQIGTTGYSQGGWAAMRTLSYPGPERLELGFAIAGGGLFDLPALLAPGEAGETNVRGSIEKEFGTLDQLDWLLSLSPSQHLDKINAPVFLYHADRDTRVSPNQSYEFAERLAAAGKPHELMIIPDQGHSIRGPEIWAGIRQRLLDFIAQVP